jgi:hypothetical protein
MSALDFKINRTRIEGLVITLVAAGYLWEAHNVPDLYQIPGVPGPTTFPLILGIIFVLCGLWLFVSPRDLFKKGGAAASERTPATPAAAEASRGGGLFAQIAADRHFYTMWAVILGYLWAMPDLGFPLATFLLLAAFVFLLGENRWAVVLGLSLAATLLIYVCFKMGLNVRLPLGVIAPLLK